MFEIGIQAGMEKVARVPTAVKQYRRAMQMLGGVKTTKGVVRDEHLFHGSQPQLIGDLVRSGGVKQLPGAHGKGVYMWKEQPLQTYLRKPDSVGVAIPKDKLPAGGESTFVAPRPDKYRPHMRVWTGKGKGEPLRLPEKSTVIAPPAELKKMREGISKGKLKQMDSQIFHRAEADWRAADHGEGKRPSKRELIRMMRRKLPQQEFAKLRASDENGIEDFLEGYADRT